MKKLAPSLKVLVAILNDGEFYSGGEIGKAIAISRNGVWKHINQLSKFGIEIEAAQSKGYRLKQPLQLLDSETIEKYLALRQAYKLDIFASIPSTNEYLKLHPKSAELHFCLAEHQSKGKGRFGRTWHSPFGANIYLSVGWHIAKDASELAGLSLAISLAIVGALTDYGVTGLAIKWPNDILLQGSKLGGVLLELVAESNALTQVIIGIGLNVNMLAAAAQPIEQAWTSLQVVTNQYHDRNKLVGLLINYVTDCLTVFNHSGFTSFIEQWQQYDYLSGKNISLLTANTTITGIVQGINEQGQIVINDENNKINAYSAGETSIKK